MDSNKQQTPVESLTEKKAETPESSIKKSKKKLIIGIVTGSILLLVMVITVLVYFFGYNNPNNAVNDALMKAMSSKSLTTSGKMTFKSEPGSMDVTADFSSSSAESGAGNMGINMTVDAGGVKSDVKAQLVADAENTYFKIEDFKELINSAIKDETARAQFEQSYGSLVDKIDSKWTVFNIEDLEEMTGQSGSSSESKCLERESQRARTDPSLNDEVSALYREYQLFDVEAKGSDKDGNRYGLTLNRANLISFLRQVQLTEMFIRLDNCSSQDMKSYVSYMADIVSQIRPGQIPVKVRFEVWVDGWSHNLNKVTLSIDDTAGTTFSTETNIKLNSKPSVNMPKAEVEYKDLKSDIEKIKRDIQIQNQATDTYDYSDYYDEEGNIRMPEQTVY